MTRNDEPGTGNGRSAPPLRTWRPMVLWSAGILLALGLAWFVAAVVVPVWQVRSTIAALEKALPSMVAPSYECAADGDTRKRNIRQYMLYLQCPDFIAPYKATAARLLGGCGYEAMPELIRTLHSRSPDVRAIAADSLGRLGSQGRPASQELAKLALTDPEVSVRDAALWALAWLYRDETDGALSSRLRLQPDAAQLMPVWTGALGDASSRVRARAADCLGYIGKDASEAIPALWVALMDRDESVRYAAAEALKQIRGEEAEP